MSSPPSFLTATLSGSANSSVRLGYDEIVTGTMPASSPLTSTILRSTLGSLYF